MLNEFSNIFHVNLIYNHSLGPELYIMLSTGGKPKSSMRVGKCRSTANIWCNGWNKICVGCGVGVGRMVTRTGGLRANNQDYFGSVQSTLSNVANHAATDWQLKWLY